MAHLSKLSETTINAISVKEGDFDKKKNGGASLPQKKSESDTKNIAPIVDDFDFIQDETVKIITDYISDRKIVKK